MPSGSGQVQLSRKTTILISARVLGQNEVVAGREERAEKKASKRRGRPQLSHPYYKR